MFTDRECSLSHESSGTDQDKPVFFLSRFDSLIAEYDVSAMQKMIALLCTTTAAAAALLFDLFTFTLHC